MKNLIFLSLITFSVNSWALIPAVETASYADLVKAAKNNSLSMTERWQAVIKAAEVASPDQMGEIKDFTSSPDWFIRNAALVALEKTNLSMAIDQAKVLVKDKALVIRSAAVTTLSKKNTIEIRQLLIEELAKNYNFSGKQSLWIRPQIMEHLTKTAGVDDRRWLVRSLFDSDQKVATLSMEALERITSLHFQGADALQKWQKHVKQNGWM